jgi:hypothetical protein
MLAEVAGLSTEAWTAIGTIAITVVGITTLVMNGRLGYHTKRSAEAAERAAVATRDAVSAQLATVGVDFKIEVWLTPEGDDFPTVVRVECDGATTWVHGVQIERLWVANQPSAANDVTCTPHDVSPLPACLHRGEAIIAIWPDAPSMPAPWDSWWGTAKVLYSFDRDGEQVSITRRFGPGTPPQAAKRVDPLLDPGARTVAA